jgi:hypothetical protein
MENPMKKKDDYNGYMRQYVADQYIAKKIRAIDLLGGRCQKCGYNSCIAAMTFHHRDPQTKEFDWNSLRKRNWKTIETELLKCDLLCNRCHTELHYDENITKRALNRFAASNESHVPEYDVVGICPICNKGFSRTSVTQTKKYCSSQCANKSQERAKYPDNDEFVSLVNEKGRVFVAHKYGVSHRAIAKRYKKIINQSA